MRLRSNSLARQREARGRRAGDRLAGGVERPEEEELVLDERSAEGDAEVRDVRGLGVHGAVRRLELLPVGSPPSPAASSRRRRRGTALRAGLRDHVHDAARGLAVLGLEAAGLDLGLLDELGGDARAERPVLAGEEPMAPKPVLLTLTPSMM